MKMKTDYIKVYFGNCRPNCNQLYQNCKMKTIIPQKLLAKSKWLFTLNENENFSKH
jgi:hypothetical protein